MSFGISYGNPTLRSSLLLLPQKLEELNASLNALKHTNATLLRLDNDLAEKRSTNLKLTSELEGLKKETEAKTEQMRGLNLLVVYLSFLTLKTFKLSSSLSVVSEY